MARSSTGSFSRVQLPLKFSLTSGFAPLGRVVSSRGHTTLKPRMFEVVAMKENVIETVSHRAI